MQTIMLQAVGWSAFVLGTLITGLWLRRHPCTETAETTSRVMHFLFFTGLLLPFVVGLFSPGLTQFDPLLGLSALPLPPLPLVVGSLAMLPGLYLTVVSNKALRARGSGANAFVLTKRVVTADIYQYTRNPMSLGFYLVCLGVSAAVGSTYLTLGALLGVIPAHLFFLRYFEEYELTLRLGEPYRQYKGRVPFLFPKWKGTS